ncbi:MAG TPA: trypsin-like peptidase domain-containing protein [Longimicrobium sp.]
MPAPYESVCRSMVYRKYVFVFGASYVSSGALLEDDMLLTAGHNYASPHAPFSVVRDRSVECGPGVAMESSPWWRVEGGFDRGDQVRHPAGFSAFDWARDYALVALGVRASRSSSFRLPRPGEILVAKDDTIFIAGYPAEDPKTGSILYHGRAKVTEVSESVIVYDLNTEKGLSGAPVWVERNGEFVLVGVHVGEGKQGEAKAHRLTDASLQNLAAWRAEFRRTR